MGLFTFRSNLSKRATQKAIFEDQVAREKGLIDTEIELYRNRAMHQIEHSLLKEKEKVVEAHDATLSNDAELAKSFYSNKSFYEIEISKFVARMEALQKESKMYGDSKFLFERAVKAEAEINALRMVIASKDTSIKEYDSMVKYLVGKFPEIKLDKFNINVEHTTVSKNSNEK